MAKAKGPAARKRPAAKTRGGRTRGPSAATLKRRLSKAESALEAAEQARTRSTAAHRGRFTNVTAQLTVQITALEKKAAKGDTKAKDRLKRVRKLEAQARRHIGKIGGLSNKIKRLERKLEAGEITKQQADAQIAKLNIDIQDVSAHLDDAIEQEKATFEAHEASEERARLAQEDAAKAKERRRAAFGAARRVIDRKEAERVAAEKRALHIAEDRDGLVNDVLELEGQRNSLREELREARGNVASVAELRGQLNGVNAQLRRMRRDLARMGEEGAPPAEGGRRRRPPTEEIDVRVTRLENLLLSQGFVVDEHGTPARAPGGGLIYNPVQSVGGTPVGAAAREVMTDEQFNRFIQGFGDRLTHGTPGEGDAMVNRLEAIARLNVPPEERRRMMNSVAGVGESAERARSERFREGAVNVGEGIRSFSLFGTGMMRDALYIVILALLIYFVAQLFHYVGMI